VINTPPSTYAEWVGLIHLFEGGEQDERVVDLLQSARVVLSAGMAERFYRRLIDVFELRLRRVSSSLQKRLDRGADAIAFGAAIVSARSELSALARFSAAPCWPEDATTMMRSSLDEFARKTNDALEESARKRERFDQGLQLSLVRKTPLFVRWPATSTPSARGREDTTPPPAVSRQIIF